MYSFDDCLYLSDEVNAETPMDFNNGFILDYTTCMDFPSGPRLIYLYRVQFNAKAASLPLFFLAKACL